MEHYKITDDGQLETVVVDDTVVATRKSFKVSKKGIHLYFGSVKMMHDCIPDLGISLSSLYSNGVERTTKTGYTISKVNIQLLPTLKKRK